MAQLHVQGVGHPAAADLQDVGVQCTTRVDAGHGEPGRLHTPAKHGSVRFGKANGTAAVRLWPCCRWSVRHSAIRKARLPRHTYFNHCISTDVQLMKHTRTFVCITYTAGVRPGRSKYQLDAIRCPKGWIWGTLTLLYQSRQQGSPVEDHTRPCQSRVARKCVSCRHSGHKVQIRRSEPYGQVVCDTLRARLTTPNTCAVSCSSPFCSRGWVVLCLERCSRTRPLTGVDSPEILPTCFAHVHHT